MGLAVTGCLTLIMSTAAAAPALGAASASRASAVHSGAPTSHSGASAVHDRPAASPRPKGPQPTKPTGDALNPRPVQWISAKPVSKGKYKGKAIKLVWWSGVEPCHVLDRVTVKRTAKRLVVTLHEGVAKNAASVMCIELAIQKTTTVKLKHPIGKRKIVDGARLKR
ncbi:hypothetical protein [Sinosporangium siamense]|uniref:Uncharacterized protein n=1 Tax=Sinosporangium siamense TaxID=1367973 RepID=A0A919RKL1_9ACTN|nr:hypothetical protein [Sinosporangium siamense]GII93624.1 hypothetical protein Ssi02_38550 [Sinosporangium siamense]